MRWFSVIISTILLLQLSPGVLSEGVEKCIAIAEENFPQEFVEHSIINLHSATQKQIDDIHSMVKDGVNAWKCDFGIIMNENKEVTNLQLPPFVFSLQVTDNPSLRKITIPKKVEKGITVTKNNKLNSNVQQLEDLRKLCKGACNVEENNECWFENAVSDPADLENCSKIRTDLSIKNLNDIPTKFTEIKCLTVLFSGISNLDFLKELKKENIKCASSANPIILQFNSNLCLSHTEAKKILSPLTNKFLTSGNYNDQCKEELKCPYADAVQADTAGDFGSCKVITGDVKLDCTAKTAFQQNLYRKLSGTLTLISCSSEHVPGIINHFKEIDAGQGIALTLKNPSGNLKALSTSTVKNCLKGKTLLKVDSDQQISFVEATKIKNTFGENNVVFSAVEPEPTGDGVCVVSKKETPLPEDCTIVYGDLFLDENTEKVNPDLKEVKGCIKIYNANKLNDYNFLKDVTIGKECLYLEGTHDIKKIGCIPLDVRKSIKKELLNIIMNKDNDNNLNCECLYKDPVAEINENCKIIDGDLIVNENTQTIPNGIEEVTGCIHVSKETTIDLSFLKTIKTFSHACLYRKDQSRIDVECVPYSLLSSITIPSNREPPRAECGECKPEKVEDFDPKCKIVIGNLLIKGVENGDVEENMKNVEEIYGVVIIKRNRADKIEFPKLKQIVVTGSSDPALKIYNNKKLVSVELPSLETISFNGSTTGRTLIHIEKNPKWNASKTMQEKVKALTGSDCSDVEGSGCFLKPVEETSRDLSPTNQLSVSDKIGICLMVTTTIMAISFFLACGLWTFLLCKTDF